MSQDELLERKLAELRSGLAKLERSVVEDLPTLTNALHEACEAADALRQIRRDQPLQKGESQYRILANAILDSVLDGVITIEEDGSIGAVNPAAARMFGYQADEVVGKSVTALLPAATPADLERYVAGEATIVRSGQQLDGLRKDGTVFSMELSLSEVPLGDRRLFTAVVRDVSSRREAEEALRRERDFAESLVETAPTIVLVLDAEGRIVRFNSYMEKISGYRLDEVRGENWFRTFVPENERPRINDVFVQTVAGTDTRGTVNPILTKAGSLRDIEWSNSVLKDAHGEVLGVLAVGQDITDKKELNAKLAKAERLAAIGELAAGVAHEINNPINTILNCAELIADGDTDPGLCTDILHEGKRITSIVHGLLDFSREPSNGLSCTSAGAVVSDTLNLIGRRIQRSGIELETTVPPELPPVRGRHGQLQQVLLNLLLNARDALVHGSKPGKRVIQVSAELTRGENGSPWVRIAVRDNGPGIPAESLKRIFDPFYTTKRKTGGTGLGLSVSHGIVQSHGGTLQAKSSFGEFTEMRIELPTSSEDPDGPDCPD